MACSGWKRRRIVPLRRTGQAGAGTLTLGGNLTFTDPVLPYLEQPAKDALLARAHPA